MKEENQAYADKGRIGRKIRVMVVGIPNVGKSSFINRIAKKNSAGVANRPGVTTQKQWIRINNQIELMDTPGVLWPKFENNEVALNLAFTGTIKDTILELTEVAYNLTKFLLKEYRQELIDQKSKVKISILCPGPVKTNFEEVANVKFQIKSLSAEKVVKYTIKKQKKNKTVIVPGAMIKCGHFLSKFANEKFACKVLDKVAKNPNN